MVAKESESIIQEMEFTGKQIVYFPTSTVVIVMSKITANFSVGKFEFIPLLKYLSHKNLSS